MIKCATLLEPIDALMRKTIKVCDYLQVDETPLQVLKEPGRSPHTLSYMWLYRTAALVHPCIVFDYQPTRGQEAPTLFLQDFKGYLQTDAYNGYDLLKAKTTIIGMGCWAHVRRKFTEIVKVIKDDGQAAYALDLIAKLYAIEAKARQEGLSPPAIYALRQKEALPLLETFKVWLDEYVLRTAPKTLLGKAIRYALNQWDMLTVYCTDGRLNIDNNLIENAIRPFAVGRKNWLFADTAEGARASAILYGIFATCKANNIPSYDYLCKALTLLPACSPNDDFTPFLPYNLVARSAPTVAKAA
jgi:transposase